MQYVPSAETLFQLFWDENVLLSHTMSAALMSWLEPAPSTLIQPDAPVPA